MQTNRSINCGIVQHGDIIVQKSLTKKSPPEAVSAPLIHTASRTFTTEVAADGNTKKISPQTSPYR